MEISKLKPLNGYIVVKDKKREEITPGGIVLANNVQDEHIIYGVVISVSEPWINNKGQKQEIVDIYPGNEVMYNFTAGAGNVFDDSGITYRVLVPVEILAKLVD